MMVTQELALRIVITNDDGYGAPGLTTLSDVVRQIGAVTIVAPYAPQSGLGHQVTMKTPIQVTRGTSENHFVVYGAPADCTRLAVKALTPGVDWILAGINPGANLGSDVYQSGTIAAVREAAILGVKAIAVSQYIAPGWVIDWQATADHISNIFPMVMDQQLAPGQFWNINLPSPIAVGSRIDHQFCPLDKHPHKYRFRKDGDGYHYEGIIHDRPRTPGSDVDICFSGRISITRMEI
jgi:5'-nucleotidase